MGDVDSILEQILEDNPEDAVIERLDDEINSGNWVEDDWEEEYCSEYDWYQDHGSGEAERVIIDKMLKGWSQKYNSGKELDGKIFLEVYEGIKENYEDLYQA